MPASLPDVPAPPVSPTVTATITRLRNAFPRDRIERGQFEEYVRELSAIPPAALEAAATEIIRTRDWFPPLAEILRVVAENTLALPDESAAVAQINARVMRQRTIDGLSADLVEAAPPFVHPLVKEALDRVGGYGAWRASNEPGILFGQFTRVYRELRAAAIRKAQVGS